MVLRYHVLRKKIDFLSQILRYTSQILYSKIKNLKTSYVIEIKLGESFL